MIKVGFIDYFLDEWHANNYPAWIKETSGGECVVSFGYAMIDGPGEKLTTDAWCEKFGVTRCATIEEITEKSDVLIVLSPDNCEFHEELCQIPLASGKPVYVDKTFSPDKASGERIFAIAEQSGTPCWSTSALRYADEYQALKDEEFSGIISVGPNGFETYSIHQLEPLVMLMKKPARRAIAVKTDTSYSVTFEFEGGAFGVVSGFVHGVDFKMTADGPSETKEIVVKSEYFMNFIRALVEFFRTAKAPVSHEDTIEIMALREAGSKALENPGVWVEV